MISREVKKLAEAKARAATAASMAPSHAALPADWSEKMEERVQEDIMRLRVTLEDRDPTQHGAPRAEKREAWEWRVSGLAEAWLALARTQDARRGMLDAIDRGDAAAAAANGFSLGSHLADGYLALFLALEYSDFARNFGNRQGQHRTYNKADTERWARLAYEAILSYRAQGKAASGVYSAQSFAFKEVHKDFTAAGWKLAYASFRRKLTTWLNGYIEENGLPDPRQGE